MTITYRPEDLKVTMCGKQIKGFVYGEDLIVEMDLLPPLDITLSLPNGKKTGCSLNLENLIKKVYQLYPEQVERIIKNA